jgi:hypothetical protein
MSDKGKIYIGLGLFLLVVTFPFWYGWAGGARGDRPQLEMPVGVSECVEDVEYMRALHMDLLNQWRDAVVRDGNRLFISSSGQQHEMSLSKTCLSCHTNKAQFCDQCHNYVGVTPSCWDCHVERAVMEGK